MAFEEAKREGRKALTEAEAKSFLRTEGISVSDFQVVRSFEELKLDKLRFPVVLKVCSPRFLHKTDAGGVVLRILSPEALKKEMAAFAKRFPEEALLVEPMEVEGVEVIVGMLHDPTFGPTVMFGAGGIYTEVYRDVTFRIVPFGRTDAEEMLGEIKAAPLLRGARGIQTDREALLQLLLRVSDLAERYGAEIDQVDLNPIFVKPKGAVAVDARIILR